MKNTSVVVAENIKRYREEKGMTTLELAKGLGRTNKSYIENIEERRTSIQLTKLDEIAEALDVKAIDLVEDWEDGAE